MSKEIAFLTNRMYAVVETNVGLIATSDDLTVMQKEEKWQIHLQTKERGEERELTLITIRKGDGKYWTGTIQDFFTIQQTLKNIQNDMQFEGDEGLVSDDTRQEINCAIGNFH